MPYTVKPGDTLWRISQDLGIPLATLMALNGYNADSARGLSVGTVLNLGNYEATTDTEEADTTNPWDTEGFRPDEDSPLWDDELMSFYSQYGLDQSAAETLAQQERERLMAQANRYFGEWAGGYMEDDPATEEDESLIPILDGEQATVADLLSPDYRDKSTGEFGIAEEDALRSTMRSYAGRGMGLGGGAQRAMTDVRAKSGKKIMETAGTYGRQLGATESDLSQTQTQLELDRINALREAAQREDLRKAGGI